MKKFFRLYHSAALVASVILLLNAPGAFAQGIQEPIDRSALMSKLASKSLLLCVTRAGKRILAAGEHGIIVYSDNNGQSWTQAKVPVSVTLTNIRFITPQKGWAVGHSGVILYSEDSGRTWNQQLDGSQAVMLMLEAAKAKAMAEPGEQTRRALANAELFVQDGPDKPFLDIYFVDELRGFIVGAYNMVFHTQDGGKSWQPWLDHVQNPDGLHLYGIQPADNYLFMAGERGLFLRSADQGQTFSLLPTPYEGSYFGLLCLSRDTILIYGLKGNAFKSSDFGNTWQQIDPGVSITITAALELADGSCVLTTQSGEVLISHDHAKTFSKIDLKGEIYPLMGIAQAINGDLVLVGTRGAKVIAVSRESASANIRYAGER